MPATPWQQVPRPAAMPAPAHAGVAALNGIGMYHASYGSGPPVVLVHGGMCHADVWAAQVADLMRDHRVIVADSRGHGRSTRGDGDFGYRRLADDWLALLDHLGLDRVALAGWSDGGIIGLDLAMRAPGRLSRLFAFAANVTPDGNDPAAIGPNQTVAEAGRWLAEDYARLSPTPGGFGALHDELSPMWASEPTWTDADLSRIALPVTIAHAAHDEMIPRPHSERIAAAIPGARLVILPDVSHFALLQAPAAFNAALRAAID